jgi:hypothetical protein
MTDDTSQPPAPQPGWVATAELRFFDNQGGWAGITFPSGWTHYVDPRTIDKLDWSPPPPPPWEPEIGKCASWCNSEGISMIVIVMCVDGPDAWVKLPNNHNRTVFACDLSPPKGGA